MKHYRRVFWWGTFLNLICLSGASMFVLTGRYLAEQGLQPWEIGTAEGGYWVGAVLSQPWLAHRVDRHGRRPYILRGAFSIGLTALGFLLMPVSLVPMVALRGLQGFVVSTYFTALFTWIADQAPPGRLAQAFGLFGISGLLAGAIGPVGGEMLVDRSSFQAMFSLSAGLSLTAAAGFLTLPEVHRAPHETQEDSHFFQLLRSRLMLAVTLGSLGFGYAIGSLYGFAAPFAAKEKLTGVGLMFACYTFSSVLIRLGMGSASDRHGPQRIIPSALLLQAGGIGLFALLGKGESWILVGTGLLAGAGHGILYPALSALAVQRLGAAVRGTALALITAWIDVGSFAGSVLSGVLAQNLGYPLMFCGVALIVMTSGLAFPAFDRRAIRP